MNRKKEPPKNQHIASVHIFLFVLQSFFGQFFSLCQIWIRFLVFLWLSDMSQYFRFPPLAWAAVTHHQPALTKAAWLVSQLCHSTKNNRRHLFWLKKIISGAEIRHSENMHISTHIREHHSILSSYLCAIKLFEMQVLITSSL